MVLDVSSKENHDVFSASGSNDYVTYKNKTLVLPFAGLQATAEGQKYLSAETP